MNTLVSRVCNGLLVVGLVSAAGDEGRSQPGPLSPADSLATFRLESPVLRLELVAAEPLVVDPVAMAFDAEGRMFVAENRGYPLGPGDGRPPVGVVARLEDRDGDGVFETRVEFAAGLSYPNGVHPWRGGLIVTCAPDLLFLEDTDGDGVADERRVLLTGFDASNTTQLRVSHPTLGPDGWFYVTSGWTGPARLMSPGHPDGPRLETRNDIRFDPFSGRFEDAGGRAQFGLCFDDFGNRFICFNRVHLQHVVAEARFWQRQPNLAFSETIQNVPETLVTDLIGGAQQNHAARIYPISDNITTADSHAGTFSAACAVTIYRGDALPEACYGNAFACDPTGNLVHRDRLSKSGATFASRMAVEGVEFLASTDNWFRPVFLATGPDGALYVCDMYRKTIEHPQYLPEEIRKRTDFDAGKGMGRIWRVTHANRKPQGRPRVFAPERVSTARLVRDLSHRNVWQRETAFRLLLERADDTAERALRRTVARRDADTAPGRVLALGCLTRLNALRGEDLVRALTDTHPGVRQHAARLSEPMISTAPDVARAVQSLASDPEPHVRFQAALILGADASASAVEALAQIARLDGADRWARAAVLSGAGERPRELWRALTAGSSADLPLPLMVELGRLVALTTPAEDMARVLAAFGQCDQAYNPPWHLAFLEGVSRTRPLKPGLGDRCLGEWTRRAHRLAEDAGAAAELRLVAIRFLANSEFETVGRVLLRLLDPAHAREVQLAAVQVLTRWPGDAAVEAMLTEPRWSSCSPAIREIILGAQVSEPRRAQALLDRVESGALPAHALSGQQRKQLGQHADPALRARAQRTFASSSGEDPAKNYAASKAALGLVANPAAGRDLFRLYCASCHRLDRDGAAVGPDLFGIRNQPKEAILLHVVDPNYEILSGFAAYDVVLRDGRSLTGLLASETPTTITVRQAQGLEETVRRDAIKTLRASSVSLMPEGLEKNLSMQQLADLLGYLKGE
jgi:putative membrane-bound dehydrogenase-like protein